MEAAVITRYGGPEVFEVKQLADPVPQPNEVLIEVKAAGINRPDVFQRKGNYPAPPGVIADVPGLEVSGTIIATGKSATRWAVGTDIMGLLPGGGYATRVCLSEDHCIEKPDALSFEEAACCPETLYTVWHNVFQRGRLQEGQTVLVHGGSGGIGSTTIQLAKCFGANVISTVGSEEKAEIARQLGADQVIHYRKANFEEILGENRVDVILDSIGGDYFAKNIHVLVPEGRLIQINAMQGAKVELHLIKLMQKRIWLSGSTLRAREDEFKTELTREIVDRIIPMIDRGAFKPLVSKIFSLHEVAEAHRWMEGPNHFGKIALTMRR